MLYDKIYSVLNNNDTEALRVLGMFMTLGMFGIFATLAVFSALLIQE